MPRLPFATGRELATMPTPVQSYGPVIDPMAARLPNSHRNDDTILIYGEHVTEASGTMTMGIKDTDDKTSQTREPNQDASPHSANLVNISLPADGGTAGQDPSRARWDVLASAVNHIAQGTRVRVAPDAAMIPRAILEALADASIDQMILTRDGASQDTQSNDGAIDVNAQDALDLLYDFKRRQRELLDAIAAHDQAIGLT